METQLKDLFKMAVFAFEAAAVIILFFGTLRCTLRSVGQRLQGADGLQVYRAFRQSFGRTLLLAMDLLVAADIILTVTLELSFKTLGMLGLLVVIRSALHLALEVDVGDVVQKVKLTSKSD